MDEKEHQNLNLTEELNNIRNQNVNLDQDLNGIRNQNVNLTGQIALKDIKSSEQEAEIKNLKELIKILITEGEENNRLRKAQEEKWKKMKETLGLLPESEGKSEESIIVDSQTENNWTIGFNK